MKKFKYFVAILMIGGAMVGCGHADKDEEASDSTEVVAADSLGSEVSAENVEAAAETEKAEGKKYVPASIGDCYVGERTHEGNGSRIWCELTFNADGTCELKSEMGNLNGTFTGTITGSEYNIAVKLSNGEEYDFVGTKDKLVAEDGLVKYVVSLEM